MDDSTIYDRWDQFMYLLSAQPGRQIISSLMDVREEAALPLPDAAKTPDIPVEPELYAVNLRTRHLPLLAQASYVRWTADPFQVQRGPRYDEPVAVMEGLLSTEVHLPAPLASSCVGESR